MRKWPKKSRLQQKFVYTKNQHTKGGDAGNVAKEEILERAEAQRRYACSVKNMNTSQEIARIIQKAVRLNKIEELDVA